MNKLNKKGFANDIIYIILGLFVFALVILLSYSMYSSFQISTSNIPEISSANVKPIIDNGEKVLLSFDRLFIMAIALLSIGVLVASYYVDSNPIFLPIALIIGAILIMFSAQFANIYSAVQDSGGLTTTILKYPLITFIFNNLPTYIAIMIILAIATIYGKLRTFSGG